MDFRPYHRFAGCDQLEDTVADLIAAGAVPPPLEEAYGTYHFSLLHKLRSARYHAESLTAYLSRQGTLDESPPEVVYRVNHHFDGFGHALGSALDILGREVLTYFALVPAGNVYFNTATVTLQAQRPGDAIIGRLNSPTWLPEFKDYRNTATHENVVGVRYEQINEMRGNVVHSRLRFPLPDDPRAAPGNRVYARNPDITLYCDTTLKRALRLINPVYADLAARIAGNGALPI